MNRLRHGDYVRDITYEQYKELKKVGPFYFPKYITDDEDQRDYYKHAYLFEETEGPDKGRVRHAYKKHCLTLLTFEEFLEKLANTYKDGELVIPTKKTKYIFNG